MVIGSGMGGMSCAAALARSGQRVLLLEQHLVPGGFTHMFGRKQFRWDVGVHAIGEMRPRDLPRRVLDWLGKQRVQFEALGDPYDRFRFPDGFEIGFAADPRSFQRDLVATFPEDQAAIDQYLRWVRRASKAAVSFFAYRSMPQWVERWGGRVQGCLRRDWWALTTGEVMDRLGIEGKLRCVLGAQWGYIGEVPSDSSFAAQALIHTHFRHGAWFPVGGAKAFAAALLATVEEAGGATLVRAEVERILVQGGRAVGVRMADGSEIRAQRVVSAAGAKTTIGRLLDEEWQQSEWARSITALPDSPAYLCLNLGFAGDLSATEAARANLWLFEEWRDDQREWQAQDPAALAPILYLSFPSYKDPTHQPGAEQFHTGECITFVPWDLFQRWRGSAYGDRGEDYLALKNELKERLLAQLRRHVPALMERVVFSELSTPLSASHFARAHQGAIYGLAAVPARYRNLHLRTRTPIKRLYLSGVDAASLGVVGAMMSGVLTAATIRPRLYRRLI